MVEQKVKVGSVRSFARYLPGICLLLLCWVRLGLDPAYAANLTPVSPLATPAGDEPLALAAGSIPSPTVTGTLTTTVSMPLVISQLPSFLPLVRFDEAKNLPIEPHPPHGATDQSPNAYLAWQIKNPQGPVQVEVLLDANDPTPQTIIYQGAPPALGLDTSTFAVETQYYWQVITINAQGGRVAGPVWTFRTEGVPAIPDVEAMITIPAGEFRMGCSPTDNPPAGCIPKYYDTPQHTVYLDTYAIDKYEVTNLQYRSCVEAGVCQRPRRFNSHRRSSYFWESEFDYFPVLYVSWWDAQTYCEWKGKRLPTEAEWEKAARGPIDTRSWPWGEESPDCTRLNYTDNSRHPFWILCVADTTQVGSYPSGASPYGVMDMAGNVFEWVADVWDGHYDVNYYAQSPYENPTGLEMSKEPNNNLYFILRGGSYRPNWYYPRVFHRHHGHHGDSVGGDKPWYRNDQVGFRCAQDVDQDAAE
jgi:formylglycine-generating enzyme required for sulfatase activity